MTVHLWFLLPMINARDCVYTWSLHTVRGSGNLVPALGKKKRERDRQTECVCCGGGVCAQDGAKQVSRRL